MAGCAVGGTLGAVNDTANNACDEGTGQRRRPEAMMIALPLWMPVVVPLRVLLRMSLSMVLPTPMGLSLCC